jgi:CIC family chloride channel protein
VGLLSAAVAIAFMRLVLGAGRLAARSGLPAWLRPAAAGLAVGVTALWLPDVLGIGTEALRFATIEGAFAPAELMVLVLAKILLTALCIGFGFAGGVFSPALLIGVLFGALCWTVVDGAGIATSGIAVYALCGMMATTSPVIGAPLATILIVFELTRNYDITIAAMVAVVFSNLVTHRLFGRSLFDVQLAARGVDLSAGRDRARLEAVPARRFAVRDPVVMGADEPLAAARDRLVAAHASVGFVTDADGTYRGRVRERDAAGEGTVAAAVRTDGPRLDETTTVLQAMRALEAAGDEAAPVVGGDGRLKGVVTRAALLQAFLDISSTLRREENAAL